MKIELDARATELLAPVSDLLNRGAALLPEAETLYVTVGEVPGYSQRQGTTLVLSDLLLGPHLHHPAEDGPLPPLDRWRRAAGQTVEAAAILGIERAVPAPAGEDWRWVGLAMDMVQVVAPALRIADEGIALAVMTGFPGAYPRAGAAVMRALRHGGQDPWQRGLELLRGGVLSAAEWLQIGEWVLDPGGARALLPLPVDRVGEIDIPCAIDAWRWQPLTIPPHRRGGRIEVEGPGQVLDHWAVANQTHRTLAGATDDVVQLWPSSGGPLGAWKVTSAEGFGQVMGAKGLYLEFEGSGRVQVTFADAFVGPLAAVRMAEEHGTSGQVLGRWNVAGAYRLGFEKLDGSSLTMHSRGGFMMPASGFGLASWLQALEAAPWAWQVNGDRLVLRGQMHGAWMDVRLRRG